MGLRLSTAATVLALLALLAPALATASTGDAIAPSDPLNPTVDSGWQAGTCNEEPPESADFCSVDTPSQFFDQAAGHPNWGFTQFTVKNAPPGESPVGELKSVRVDLPVGLSVNPGAGERCPLVTFKAGASGCPAGSKVGESLVTAAGPLGAPIDPIPGVTEVPVYNVIPEAGEPARFGLELAGNEVYLEADVAWDGDYHEGFTIQVPKTLPLLIEGLPVQGVVLKNRLVFDGRSGDGTFITTPSTCLGEAFPWGPAGHAYSTYLRAGTYQEAEQPGYVFPQSAEPPFESPIPEGTEARECETIPYDPSIELDPGTTLTNSPSGAAVEVQIPHLIPDFGAAEREQDSSVTRAARVTLSERMGINPSAATGLKACSDVEFAKGTKNAISCPPESKVGAVTIKSPPLPEGDLEGNVYIGKQLSRDPSSGNEYRIFVAANSDKYGISVRLVGNVSADPRTGRLTTTFTDTPQVPFSSFALRFDGGPRAVLSSPPTCGPNDAAAVLTPWSANPAVGAGDGFTLTSAPGGDKCAKTMAERPFAPTFAAAPAGNRAGAFSPFSIRISRPDGQQELKGADVVLPPGMTGRLAGTPYCGEAALAAAANSPGGSETTASSCPSRSQVGSASIEAGTGSSPLRIGGKVFLSGPYHGAPLSLAVVTPATAGPFDLGTVVVRVALFLDPITAQIRAVADPILDVFGGAQLSIRSVDVAIDKDRFTLNPTSCNLFATAGALNGGGADPTNPAAFSAFPVSAPFQTSECGALRFRPKLFTRLFGSRKKARRAQHPRFRAVLAAREGDANIRRVALTLPHSELLDQAHIGTVCIRGRLAAHDCPASSVYGHARAKSPLLDDELAGPVYLVPGSNELPDLVADLRGQVNIQLHGVISGTKGRLKTVFNAVPDVPVSKFTLTMLGGKRGLLVNSRDLCAGPNFSFLNFEAQNGKRLHKKRLPLRMPSCRHRRSAKHRAGD